VFCSHLPARDYGLSERQSSIVGGYPVMDKHLAAALAENGDGVLQKAEILESAAAQTDSMEPIPFADANAGINDYLR
jgi:hypothetical protein